MTPLDKTLKRALTIKGEDFVITLSPETLKVSRKGHRLGIELKWSDLISGDTALAVALHASLGRFEGQEASVPEKSAVPVTRKPRPRRRKQKKRR